jgi:hypothetical protein
MCFPEKLSFLFWQIAYCLMVEMYFSWMGGGLHLAVFLHKKMEEVACMSSLPA